MARFNIMVGGQQQYEALNKAGATLARELFNQNHASEALDLALQAWRKALRFGLLDTEDDFDPAPPRVAVELSLRQYDELVQSIRDTWTQEDADRFYDRGGPKGSHPGHPSMIALRAACAALNFLGIEVRVRGESADARLDPLLMRKTKPTTTRRKAVAKMPIASQNAHHVNGLANGAPAAHA